MPLPRATFSGVIAAFLAVGCAATLAGDLAAATPKQRIAEKQAEARSVLDQVNQLDRRFEANVEAWNGARLQLSATRHQLTLDRGKLRVAERARVRAVMRVRARLVALYETDDNPTALSIILGATTLSDMLDRLDAAHQIAASDHALAVQATQARDRAATLAYRTSALEQQQAATVARLNGQLLASVQSEVRVLQAQEARRQARLAAEARARLAAEAAARAAAAAKAKAAAEAEAKAAAKQAADPAPAATTTTTTQAEAPPATTTALPPTTTVAPATPVALGPGHPEAAQIALRYLGVKYVWGGASPDGFDCSGLVMYVYAQLGIQLPHFAAAQYAMGQAVPSDQLQPGDLVFFDGLDHVGIYIGGGQMVHAPQTGDVVKITPLSAFGNRYVGARRI